MKRNSQRRATGKKQPEQLILRGRVRRDPLGIGLLVLSGGGIVLNSNLFPRLARIGGILQQVSTGILFGRVIVFIAARAPRRQRLFPRLLTFMELLTDGVATIAGFSAWIWPGYSRREPSRGGWVAHTGRIGSTITFALHTLRVAIYLSPSRGLSEQDIDGPPSPYR